MMPPTLPQFALARAWVGAKSVEQKRLGRGQPDNLFQFEEHAPAAKKTPTKLGRTKIVKIRLRRDGLRRSQSKQPGLDSRVPNGRFFADMSELWRTEYLLSAALAEHDSARFAL